MKQKIIIYSVAIFISILLVGLGITFAYYSATTSSDADSDVSVQLSDLATLDFTKGDDFSLLAGLTNFSNGDENLYEKTISSVKLTATGDYTATYYVYFVINQNDFEYTSSEAELLLVITDPDDNKVTEINGLVYTASDGIEGFDVTEENGVFEISIDEINATDSSKTEYWTFELYFINLDTDQNDNASKTFDSVILLQAEPYGSDTASTFIEGSLSEAIMLNQSEFHGTDNTIGSSILSLEIKGEPDFSAAATTDEGVFATEDDYGTSYYFRGDVEDNYVVWGGFFWRIIRLDGQGNVKLIYAGVYDEGVDPSSLSGSETRIGNSAFNPNTMSSPELVGYMYTEGEIHGSFSDSVIKTVIDSWFSTNLVPYESDLALDGIFCVDRTSYTNEVENFEYTTSTQLYGAYYRITSSKNPSLECTNTLDTFTWEKSSNGTNALIYPVALITADEVSLAGEVIYYGNYFYPITYLNNESKYWTLTPSRVDSIYLKNYFVDGTYSILSGSISIGYTFGVRPVVYLDSSVTFTSGDGTSTNPYIVS